MGESTCLMQPFSYAAGIPHEANEGNPIHSLGQSVSFGRYMTESLAWEKWSTFSHNRYVEEAERHSRQGSVAQKKAFFEAHYKNLAARKAAAAALMEQENAASNNVPQQEPEVEVNDITTNDSPTMTKTLNSQVAVDEKQEVELLDEEAPEDTGGCNLNAEADGMESRTFEGTDPVENDAKIESLDQLGAADNNEEIKEMNHCEMKQMEKPLLKNFKNSQNDLLSASDRKPSVSSSKSSNYSKASRVPSSPANHNAPIRPKKENIATPMRKKPTIHTDKMIFTPKSMSFTPGREFNKLTSTIIRKIDGSRITSNSKPSKDFSTPLKTPTTASVRRESKHPLATPQSETRREKESLDTSASGRKMVRSKWNCLPTDCPKFLSSSKNKSQSPSFSTPFSLRTEERAAIRKKKLEEKFNASQAQRVQQQTTLKEKAETELRKLRQSLCFKARPLPDFYKDRGTSKNQMKKVLLAHPESPKLGKQFTPSRVHGNTSETPQRPSIKSKSSKFENNQTRTHSVTSRPIVFSHENTSPNIQQQKFSM
ncbi:protein WVD2-like 7 [Tripterygium wilfordii]|uniref:protein WVD2-like 7 n=1 Tax=Tripterygium wilfordii TaxID=458696 RepID=UPI0018F81A53|nr:protein WVD2-like 7 [Tripterygium wilfordii]